MNELQSNLLGLLEEIDEICEANEISYMLAAGGLLGAIREGGFLPWDDDLDIYMTRDNWEKFKIAVKDNLPKDRFLIHHENNPMYGNPLPRYGMNSNTLIYKTFLSLREYCGQHVEIFVFDPLPKGEKEKFEHIKLLKIYTELLSDYFVVNSRNPSKLGEFDYERYKKYYYLTKIIGKKKVLKILEKKLFRINEADCNEMVMRWGIKTHCFEKKALTVTQNINFEGKNVKASNTPELLFRKGYGDNWMYVPDLSGQITHDGVIDFKTPCKDYFFNLKQELPAEKKLFRTFKKSKKVSLANNYDREALHSIMNSLILELTRENNIKNLKLEIIRIKDLVSEGKIGKAEKILKKYMAELAPLSDFGSKEIIFYNKEFSKIIIEFYLKKGEFFNAEKALNNLLGNAETEIEYEKSIRKEIEFSRNLSIAIYDNNDPNMIEKILETDEYAGIKTSLSYKARLYVLKNQKEVNAQELIRICNSAMEYNGDDGEFLFYLGIAKHILGEKEAYTVLAEAVDKTRNGLIIKEIADKFKIHKLKDVEDNNSDYSDAMKEFYDSVKIIFEKTNLENLKLLKSQRCQANLNYSTLEKLLDIIEKEELPITIETHINNDKLNVREAYIISTQKAEFNLKRPFRILNNGIKIKVNINKNGGKINKAKERLINGQALLKETIDVEESSVFWKTMYKITDAVVKVIIGKEEKKAKWLQGKLYSGNGKEKIIYYDNENREEFKKSKDVVFCNNLKPEEITALIYRKGFEKKYKIYGFRFRRRALRIIRQRKLITNAWEMVKGDQL